MAGAACPLRLSCRFPSGLTPTQVRQLSADDRAAAPILGRAASYMEGCRPAKWRAASTIRLSLLGAVPAARWRSFHGDPTER
jgi:hypothetical protein